MASAAPTLETVRTSPAGEASREIRLLIVDDNARTRAALRALFLTTPGIRVVAEAASGEESIRQVQETSPDVVLMDVRLPGMDGLDATRRIKAAEPGVRVVVLTLFAAYSSEALAAGADAFLVKGGPAVELISAVLGRPEPGGVDERRGGPRNSLPQRPRFGPRGSTVA